LFPSFDLFQFRSELFAKRTLAAFEKDIEDAAFVGINCLPTLLFRTFDGRTGKLCGFSSFQVMDQLIAGLVEPHLSADP
jgi:hypothetical protein